MAITAFGSAQIPADNGTLFNTAGATVVPPASMVAGDLVYLLGIARSNSADITIGVTGGQSWTSQTLRAVGTSVAFRVFSCRFNGTWAANPRVDSTVATDRCISAIMSVFRPTAGSNTWAVDVAETSGTFSAPVSPFDATATGQTSIAASTVTIFAWVTADKNTWALQTGGFTNSAGAQHRNVDTGSSRNQSASIAHKIQTSAAATGNVTNRQTALGGDQGRWVAITFKEQSSGVTIADAGDELYYDGETAIPVSGTTFGASQGAGRVVISPADDIGDAGAVEQTVTAWADTAIQFTADLATFTPFAQLYLFVENNAAASNSSGRLVKRESRMYVRETLEDLAGSPVASETNIRYRVTDTTINGTELLTGTTEATDGSGDIEIGPYTLTEGGDLSVGDDVWVVLAIEGASQAASKGTCVKITPDYE